MSRSMSITLHWKELQLTELRHNVFVLPNECLNEMLMLLAFVILRQLEKSKEFINLQGEYEKFREMSEQSKIQLEKLHQHLSIVKKENTLLCSKIDDLEIEVSNNPASVRSIHFWSHVH